MAKIYSNSVLTFLLVFITTLSFSQTSKQIEKIKQETNIVNLRSIEESSKIRVTEAKEKALQMAQIKGWPITFTENGSFHELMSLSKDNQPVYYKTLNQNAAI